jgi:UPF0755 protein
MQSFAADDPLRKTAVTVGVDRRIDDDDVVLQDKEDSLSLYDKLLNGVIPTFYDKNGKEYSDKWVEMMKESIATILPYFNTDRMVKEYHRFWTKERRQKAKKLHLSPVEITTLASIVQKESLKKDEQPIIAGVYINRLRKGMLLQADPTVIYAIGDFSKRRLLRKDLDYDSPYNTYKYNGLPPGPICVPSRSCIDAILNYKHHRYLYFCAKEDFSGRHNFASTLSQHNRNAKKYQHALNKRKIYN